MPNLSKNVFSYFFAFFLIIRTIPYLQLNIVKSYTHIKDDINFSCCKLGHSKHEDPESASDPKPFLEILEPNPYLKNTDPQPRQKKVK